MRILITSVCCSVVFLPISGHSSLANTTDKLPGKLISSNTQTTNGDRQIAGINKQDYLAQTQWTTDSTVLSSEVAQTKKEADSSWNSDAKSDEAEEVKFKLQELSNRNFTPNRGSPALTIANPYGFGSDQGFYSSLSYQTDTRLGNDSDGDATMGFGVGVGDSRKAVGAELSYTLASFGNNRDFGTGGFNAKVHRQLGNGWGVAAGWNSFLSVGDDNDLQDSLYLVTTKIFKTRENLDSAFSRVAATVGVGNGQFRTESAIEDDEEQFNVFGSLAFRVAPPVSFITEWTGQDLALGLSASPFRTIPVTINIGVRDLTGAGDGARFVAGVGTSF